MNKYKKILFPLCVFALLIVFAYHLITIESNNAGWLVPIWWALFGYTAFTTVTSYLNGTYEKPEHDLGLRTTVVIPCYNEDRETFQKMLNSISYQTKLPDVVCVIEDGSNKNNVCEDIFKKWAVNYPEETLYKYIKNSGKREAQAVAFRMYMYKTDVFVTLDSDTILDENAIEKGLYPFQDKKVMSVGGTLLDYNNKSNLLTRVVGLSFVSAFSNGRASISAFGSVIVNHGALAFYRKQIIQDNLNDYLNQIILGRKQVSGDDRMLTQYASLVGKTVYQETSIGYTLNPTKLSHLARQRTRWWRNFWRCGWEILKRQSPKKPVWWFQAARYARFFIYIPAICWVVVHDIMHYGVMVPEHWIIYIFVLGYIRRAGILRFNRNDMSKREQLFSYLVFSPFASILNIFLSNILEVYALLTAWSVKTWGTRKDVEVNINKNGGKK